MTLQRTEVASALSGYAIETHLLTKRFSSFTAVDHVDLAVGEEKSTDSSDQTVREEHNDTNALYFASTDIRKRKR